MTVQTNALQSKLETIETKADEYDKRSNIDARVNQAGEDIQDLNREVRKLSSYVIDLETQAGILTQVFHKNLPSEVEDARDCVDSIIQVSQDDVVDIIDDSGQTLSMHTEEVRRTRDDVASAQRTVNDRLKQVQKQKLSTASTAESIQKIIGENREAMGIIDEYRSFLRSILDPDDSVQRLNSRWQGTKEAFEDIETDWEKFRKRHGLGHNTIDDLKTLSDEGEVDLDKLSAESLDEMMGVQELRSTIKVSL